MNLDAALVKRLSTPIWAVWNECGSDVYACAEECNAFVDNEVALETCIDADRLTTIARDKEADALIAAAIEEHSYKKVMKFLTKNFKLA